MKQIELSQKQLQKMVAERVREFLKADAYDQIDRTIVRVFNAKKTELKALIEQMFSEALRKEVPKLVKRAAKNARLFVD